MILSRCLSICCTALPPGDSVLRNIRLHKVSASVEDDRVVSDDKCTRSSHVFVRHHFHHGSLLLSRVLQ